MLKLKLTPPEPAWIDLLPEVRVRVLPGKTVSILAAREAAAQVYRAEGATDDPEVGTRAAVAMVRAYAQAVIVEWEGIGDVEGAPAPVTPENVGAAMNVWPFYEAVDRLVMAPALAPLNIQAS